MDTTILVEKHIQNGETLLVELFKKSWKITVAFWNRNELSNQWKLYLSIPTLRSEGSRSIYLQLTKMIGQIQPALSIDVDDIVLIHSNEPAVKELRNKLTHNAAKYENTKSIHLNGDQKISGESIGYMLQNIKRNKYQNI